MLNMPARGMAALAIAWCASFGVAYAADPLPAEAQLTAASTAAAPTQGTFTIASSQDLVITLTDLQIPNALTSAGVVVTQNGAIAASALLAAPATSATASITAASGDYTIYVFGVPNAASSVGTFTACVAPKANPSSCIQSASLSGNITARSTANDPTISTLSTSFVVNTADTFTFNYGDLNFPAALKTAPSLALFQGSTTIQAPVAAGSSIALAPGRYQLLGIAQADPTTKSGLYGVTIVGAIAGSTPLIDATVAVGLTPPASTFINPTAQTATVKVTDYAFPGALAGASALLTLGGTPVGTASAAGGAASLMVPAGTVTVWTYGSIGATPGTFSVDVAAGLTDLFTTAQGVGPVGSAYAYAFVTPVLAAGTYQAASADLQFPAQLSGVSLAVVQNGVILQQSSTGASTSVDLTAGPAVLLVGTQTPASAGATGTGLFDVSMQTSGASGQLVYDKTQVVNASAALLSAQSLTLASNGSFDAALTDLKFPSQFDSLAMVISQGSTVLGKVFGGGVVTFAGSPGTYQLTFVAAPSTEQLFGLYAFSIVNTPPAPTVTVTSSASSAVTGASVQLTWSSTNATSCTASGGSWTGDKQPNSTAPESVILSATTTYKLDCTGTGGTASGSVTVTATAAPGKSGGGGSMGFDLLGLAALLGALRLRRREIAGCPEISGRGVGGTF